MAVLSPENQPRSKDTKLSTLLAVGAVGIAALFTQAESTPENSPDRVHIREAERDPLPDVTTDTRASVKKYERMFNCDIQLDTRPDPLRNREPTPKQKRCAQHIAGVIGKNTYDWGPRQQEALVALWTRESDWDANADNPRSTAYGIPQALLGDHAPDIKHAFGPGAASFFKNTVSQIQWGIDYIHERYGTPIAADKAWHSRCGGQYGCWY